MIEEATWMYKGMGYRRMYKVTQTKANPAGKLHCYRLKRRTTAQPLSIQKRKKTNGPFSCVLNCLHIQNQETSCNDKLNVKATETENCSVMQTENCPDYIMKT